MCLIYRYQPDGATERQLAFGDKVFLTSGVAESDLTESESHLNMLKGGSSMRKVALWPPSSPSEHSSRLVNISICVLGEQLGTWSSCPPTTLNLVDVCFLVYDEHSRIGVRAELHHHLPHPLHPGHESLGPGPALHFPSGFLQLRPADLQATSD